MVKLPVVRSSSSRSHPLRGRPARRPAERVAHGPDRRQDPPHRRALGDGPARHRDHQLRQPEVDPAARRRRRGVARGSRASRASSTRRWCPNRQGLDAAIAAGMREVAVFMSASETHNKKNVNKTIAETLAAFRETVPPALAAGAARARLRLDGVRLPLRGRGRSRPRRWSCVARAARARLLPGLARRHDRRRQPAAGARRARRACWPRSRRPRWRSTSTTRAARRWPTSWWRSRWASPPSTPRWAASAAAPTRPAPPATSRPRTSSTCWRGWACAPASTSTSWSTARGWRRRCVGHEMPSKYYRAAVGARSRSAG